ncbi:MAG TPA: ThiF family adenylyltransferase [Chloroflexia bacterium]|jgi:molybdopterin/thiamine biosynthesis adenylyltransferase
MEAGEINWKEADRLAYFSRMEGLLSQAFHSKVALCVGSGAGSYMEEKLARLGPARMRLVDFDRVELPNLGRTAYTVSDLGDLKVDALARKIREANPFVQVKTLSVDICALSEAEQAALFQGVDLVIAGTDHFPAQALINRWSQKLSIPAVFIGIHEGARGGRVIWSLPDWTPCYRCVARDRYEHFEQAGIDATDLPGARGLLPDIQFIDMIALKLCVALLERGQDSAMGRFFDRLLPVFRPSSQAEANSNATPIGEEAIVNALEERRPRSEIIVRTSPDYDFGNLLWNAILSDLPTEPKAYASELKEEALFALDTVWLRTRRNSDCPDCGDRARGR